MNNKLQVIDFFCGAGGFSEGFRQQGFEIIMGIDNWRPAVETHNLNHNLNDTIVDVLEFENDIDKINGLPNTDIIIGSPPCVTFSMSNNAGKADKSLGIKLIEAYLRVVAVKKHQPNSILLAWLMENVPNSRNYVKENYSFEDLNLHEWAIQFGKLPDEIALRVKNNGGIYTASDYGSPQSRQRFICGEIVSTGNFPEPQKTHGIEDKNIQLKRIITLHDIKGQMPTPIEKNKTENWTDPNYHNLIVNSNELTDHFYDTGVYKVEWMKAKEAKVNHPFMGRMSFPEDENRPSRTIMATRSASTREAILYKSEYNRKGDGEYRLPTIREAATLMGFPYTYQFTGSEGTKWRLIGNAVCPHMSAALAKSILLGIGRKPINDQNVEFPKDQILKNTENLNNLSEQNVFSIPPKRQKGAKFRMHPFKVGNMTVALTNFDPLKGSDPSSNGQNWYGSIFIGSGKEYSIIPLTKQIYVDIVNKIDNISCCKNFLTDFESKFHNRIPNSNKLQNLFEMNIDYDGEYLNPTILIDKISQFIEKYDPNCVVLHGLHLSGIYKDQIPLRQTLSMIAIFRITQLIGESK
jgi:DNA (cytosine-5)-methyltransferase 1